MGRYALIEDGLVANVIMLEPGTEGFEDAVECPEGCSPGWSYEGGEFSAPEREDNSTPYLPSTPTCVATATLSVVDGFVDGLATAVGLSMAFALDVGHFLVFFSNEHPDMNYTWNAGASQGSVNVVSRDLTSMEIKVYEGGVTIDPSEISIQVFRVL